MKKIISLSFGIFILYGSFFAAYAQTPLSGNDIRHFIKAMKPLQKLGRKYDFKNSGNGPAESLNITNFFPMSRSLKTIKDNKGYGEFKAVIRKAGFSSPEQWASIGDRIMRAYVFLKLTKTLTPEKIRDLQKNVAVIEKNKYLSLEMRKKFLDNLKQTIAMARKMPKNITADQASLKPFSAELKRLFKEQE
ncbi:MAG: hypothetical protein GXP02_07150 [Alphaproteobacteria bacterium]|nr:hypothetical protein [Alphaproteobacteria bacterium]